MIEAHCCVWMRVCRLGSPFAVHVSRDVSNSELRAALIDCMMDMFKDSAFSQVRITPITHAQPRRFNGHFPRKPWSAGFSLDSQFSAKTLIISSDWFFFGHHLYIVISADESLRKAE